MAYLNSPIIAGVGSALVFAKNCRNCSCVNFLNETQSGIRVFRNTPFEPLTTFLRQTMQSGQVSKKVNK